MTSRLNANFGLRGSRSGTTPVRAESAKSVQGFEKGDEIPAVPRVASSGRCFGPVLGELLERNAD
jgi:hypothetical protein